MTDSKETARRIIALGLDIPNWEYSPLNEAFVVDYCPTIYLGKGAKYRHPRTGILWTELVVDGTHELLPALDDYALLGWLIAELERIVGPVDIIDNSEPGLNLPPEWSVSRCADWRDGPDYNGETRIEALTAALKAAKEAQ